MKLRRSEMLETLASVASDIAAFWFTAAFAIPIFTPGSSASELIVLIADIVFGIVFLVISYLLKASKTP